MKYAVIYENECGLGDTIGEAYDDLCDNRYGGGHILLTDCDFCELKPIEIEITEKIETFEDLNEEFDLEN